MAVTRKEKVQIELEKAKERLAEQQARIRELESKKMELENLEIVDTVRGLSIPLDDLAPLLQAIKSGTLPASGQKVQKMKSTTTENEIADKEAETE